MNPAVSQSGCAPLIATSLTVPWTASDPNGDKLEYSLYYKGVDESVWKELETELASLRRDTASRLEKVLDQIDQALDREASEA